MAGRVLLFFSVLNSILVVCVLLEPVETQGPTASCVPEIQVRKNTVYPALSESLLNISCPVRYCKEIPAVKWIKINDTNHFILISKTNQITITQEQTGPEKMVSYLSFMNISRGDIGIYRCMISTPAYSLESHNINVNVSDHSYANVNNTTGEGAVSGVKWLLYVCIGLGTLSLVVIVMLISILCINRYSMQANSRSHKNIPLHPKPLNATTSGKSQEIPKEQNNIYDTPTDDVHPDLGFLYTGNNQECTPDTRSRNGSGDESQVHTQIVYATLQHPTAQEPFAVRHQSREQLSEYASIRIS